MPRSPILLSAATLCLVLLAGGAALASSGRPATDAGPEAGAGPEVRTAAAPTLPVPDDVAPHAPKIIARLPDCAAFAGPETAAGHFHARLRDICTAIDARMRAGAEPNTFDLYGAIQLDGYLAALGRLRGGAGAAAQPSEASAYLIARHHKLFRLHRAMFGTPERIAADVTGERRSAPDD